MSALINYETDEDPEEYTRRVCEWHAANTGPPLTDDEVMLVHEKMTDPESRRRCRIRVKALTGPGGEYTYLRETGKFAVNRRTTAERYGLPYRRVRRLPVINRMKLIDKHRKTLAAREHVPATIKEPHARIYDGIEQGMCRYQSLARSYEMLESLRESGSATNYEFRMKDEMIASLLERVAFLEELSLAFMGGQRRLSPPAEDAAPA